MKPFKGTGYDVMVKPGEKKTVMIRQDKPTGFSMSSSMQNGVVYGKEKLIELCKSKGKKTQRVNPTNKQPADIFQYQYKHTAGICYFYEN